MTKLKIMRAAFFVGSGLIIIGVILMALMLGTIQEANVIHVELEGDGTEALQYENLGLLPGTHCEYVIKMEQVSVEEYDLSLDFSEIVDPDETGTLKHYARVRIVTSDGAVCDELLETAFEADPIVLHVDFKEKKNTELTVTYYLPLEVGNEAKNAKTTFELLLTASSESGVIQGTPESVSQSEGSQSEEESGEYKEA